MADTEGYRRAAPTDRWEPVRSNGAGTGARGHDRTSTGRTWRTRIGLVAGLAGLLAGLAVVLTPAAASAGAIVPCPSGISEWRKIFQYKSRTIWEGYRYTLHSSTPTFMVSDGRVLDNGTDNPISYQITSSVSQTFSVTQTVGIQTNPTSWLTASVSTQIVASRTTAIGVSITTTVPPRSRLIAEYGVEGYYVTYAMEAWRAENYTRQPPLTGDRCEEWGYYPQSTYAPTLLEGWRLRT